MTGNALRIGLIALGAARAFDAGQVVRGPHVSFILVVELEPGQALLDVRGYVDHRRGRVGVDLLPDLAARAKSQAGRSEPPHAQPLRRRRRLVGKDAGLRLVDANLDAADLLPAGEAALHRGAAPQRQGDELADEALTRIDPV